MRWAIAWQTDEALTGDIDMSGATPKSSESFNAARPAAPPLQKISLQRAIIYGPVSSRRLGQSLGINLLPTDYKLCSFDCLYCQYGWTKHATFAPANGLKRLPSVSEVESALSNSLAALERNHKTVDSITLCSNAEPTLYPALAEVILAAKRLRDRYQPQARVAIISNSSTVGNPTVRAALDLLDLKFMKFDAGSEAMFRRLNHPTAPVYIGEIIAGLKPLKNCYLQSCFVQGKVTNADPDSVALWIEKVREIRPFVVHVYSLDREPPDRSIERVSLATLQWIANELRWRASVEAEVF
jgi:wyosine [tRNA(Phe)-imidazoG37] synthetase (radical SAM superfamily)